MKDPETQEIFAPYQAFYIQSMLFNAEAAARSINNVNAILSVVLKNSPNDPISALPTPRILGDLQNFIVQAASLSRYFWPVRKGHEWRGIHLRKAFRISDDNPLHSRELRNSIEHFDEQLDDYLKNGMVGHVLPEYVGLLPNLQEVPVHLFRAYYIDRGIFELLGRRYEINPIAAVVQSIHIRLIEMDKRGSVFGVPGR